MRSATWMLPIALLLTLSACEDSDRSSRGAADWNGEGEGEGEGSGEGEGEGEGMLGGPCYRNGTCNEGLACIEGLCSEPIQGMEGASCYPNGTCDAGLFCEAGCDDTCAALGATCAGDASALRCECPDGQVYFEGSDGCAPADIVLVMGIGGADVASPTEGADIDAISLVVDGVDRWCADVEDVDAHPGPGGDVDAAHRTLEAVVGPSDGRADRPSTYHSLGLPQGGDAGWVSCRFADQGLGPGSVVRVMEVGSESAVSEPFQVWLCASVENVPSACVLLGEEDQGADGPYVVGVSFEVEAVSDSLLPLPGSGDPTCVRPAP